MIRIEDLKIQISPDYLGREREELLIRFSDPDLTMISSKKAGPFFLCVREKKALLSVTLFRGELKYFFPDYQNYYYLPAEDSAVHKSVSAYVPKDRKKKATKKTAYVRHSGFFLPWPIEPSGQKLFYREYGKTPAYILFPEEEALPEEALVSYVSELCSLMIK